MTKVREKSYRDLVHDYRKAAAAEAKGRELMEARVAGLLAELYTKKSLRQVAIEVERSPSYISLVASGKAKVSPDTFSRLVSLWISLNDPSGDR